MRSGHKPIPTSIIRIYIINNNNNSIPLLVCLYNIHIYISVRETVLSVQ